MDIHPIIGIVAEYNPFHNGHAWQIRACRERLGAATPVVVAMSGSLMQRGELAAVAKHRRAEMAVLGGADLVLELPSAYACASAGYFAQAAVSILAQAGITHLSFGVEEAGLAQLNQMAAELDNPALIPHLREHLSQGLSFPLARMRALQERLGQQAEALKHPNQILAVEYLRALKQWRDNGLEIQPLPLERVGSPHDAAVPVDSYASASYIRRGWKSGADMSAYLPEATQQIFLEEKRRGLAPISTVTCEKEILMTLRRMTPEVLGLLPDVSEGIENRLLQAAGQASSLHDLYERTKTKRYTHARIRRLVMCAWLGLARSLSEAPIPYLRVLAMNSRGQALLRGMARTDVPLLVKPAHVRKMSEQAQRLFVSECRVTDLFWMACPAWRDRPAGQEWLTGPIIVGDHDS